MNIIRADLYRLVRSKGPYITLGIYLFFILMQSIVSSVGHMGVQTEMTDTMEPLIFTGTTAAFEMMKAGDNLLYFLLPFIIFIGAADFSSGTAKNVLANGINRTKYYLSKLISTSVVCFLLMLIMVVVSIVCGTIKNGFGGTFDMDFIIRLSKPFFTQLLLCLGVNSVAIFFTFVTRRTAAVNGIFIAFCTVPLLVVAILADINSDLDVLAKFDVVANIRMVVPFDALATADLIRVLAIGTFYILASTIGGIYLFRRSEIK